MCLSTLRRRKNSTGDENYSEVNKCVYLDRLTGKTIVHLMIKA